MSQENVEIVLRFFEAWNQCDYERALEAAAPGVELHEPVEFPDAKILRGHEAIESWLASWPKLSEQPAFAVEDIAQGSTENTVVALVRFSGSGKRSKIYLGSRYLAVFEFEHGKATEVHLRPYHGGALEAVGLGE